MLKQLLVLSTDHDGRNQWDL